MVSGFLFEEGRTFERGRVREKDMWEREGECIFSVRVLASDTQPFSLI
jgi:hypothetical protein